MSSVKRLLATISVCFVSGCGTTYTLPDLSDTSTTKAKAIFAQESSQAQSKSGVRKSPKLAMSQYRRVVARVEPVAEKFCATQMVDVPNFNCDVQIKIDTKMAVRNAYQTYEKDGTPIVAFTLPMIEDARNEHELAFVLGHEFGHHIGQHIKKSRQQAVAGAILLGALTAAASSNSAGYNPYASQNVDAAMDLGFALGNRAFSQSYELESDVIGTHIATAAGYDAVQGARYFARPEPLKSSTGNLSFWGTHPPDEKRVATVIATVEQIRQKQALKKAQ